MNPDFLDLPGPIRLRLALCEPADPRPLTVVVCPGRSEFCEKYDEVTAHLAALGYRSLVFDWRGQGHSTRLLRDPQKGHVDRFESYLDDLDAVLAQAETHAASIALLAHSMGAHLALRALARWPGRIRGAVLSAPMIAPLLAPLGTARARAVTELMAGIGFGHHYVWRRGPYGGADRQFAGNRLTHDEARFLRTVGAIAADPALALGGPTWGWLRAALRSATALRREAADGRIAVPLLAVAAGDERIVDNAALAALAPRLPNARLVTVEGAAHELMMEADPYRLAFWREAEPFLDGLVP